MPATPLHAPGPSSPRTALLHAGGCALAVLVATLLTQPAVEMAFCDDFSYIYTALVMAKTGHIAYNGWATAMLGWQLGYVALWIKLFGFSLTKAHAAGLPLGMLTAALAQRVLVRLGLCNRDATFATLVVSISALYIPLSFSMMSDIPGTLVVLLCLYACLRALTAETDRAALGWVIFAALSNMIGGTVRQISWLGLMVMVPSTILLLRRRRGMLLGGATVWLISILLMVACMRWFTHQPYTLIEQAVYVHLNPKIVLFFRFYNWCCINVMYILPVAIAFLLPSRLRLDRKRVLAVLAAALVSLLLAHWLPEHILPFDYDWMRPQGLDIYSLPGLRPTVIPFSLRVLFTMLIFASLLLMLAALWRACRESEASLIPRIARHPFTWILGPFLVCYLLLIFTRAFIFARYFLPVMFLLAGGAMRLYRRQFAEGIPWASWLLFGVYAVFSIATVHDLFATQRARLGAAGEMIARGIPPTQFWAGFEYDGWTQIDTQGYLNDRRLHAPTAFYRTPPTYPLPKECTSWFGEYAPSIHPRIELTYEPLPCLHPAPGFAPYAYTTWLAPRHRVLYFMAVPPPLPVQTTSPERRP